MRVSRDSVPDMVVVISPPSEVVDRSFVGRLLDFEIRHLVLAGEEWLLVKAKPDFGLGGQ
jgi:hypothetical protein